MKCQKFTLITLKIYEKRLLRIWPGIKFITRTLFPVQQRYNKPFSKMCASLSSYYKHTETDFNFCEVRQLISSILIDAVPNFSSLTISTQMWATAHLKLECTISSLVSMEVWIGMSDSRPFTNLCPCEKGHHKYN